MVDMSPSLMTRCSLGSSVLAKVYPWLSAILTRSWRFLYASVRTQGAYGLVGGVTNLLAHQLVHPGVGLVILAAVVREAGDDERHVGGCCWVDWVCLAVFLRFVFGSAEWSQEG